jgi:hypothetical protein
MSLRGKPLPQHMRCLRIRVNVKMPGVRLNDDPGQKPASEILTIGSRHPFTPLTVPVLISGTELIVRGAPQVGICCKPFSSDSTMPRMSEINIPGYSLSTFAGSSDQRVLLRSR